MRGLHAWPLVVAPKLVVGALLLVRSRRLQAGLLGTAFTLELKNGWSTGL
jgi:hypothetical protein